MSPLPPHNCPNNLGQLKSVLIYFLISLIDLNGGNQNSATCLHITNDFVQVIWLHPDPPASTLSCRSGCLGRCQWMPVWGISATLLLYWGKRDGIWKSSPEARSYLFVSGFCLLCFLSFFMVLFIYFAFTFIFYFSIIVVI